LQAARRVAHFYTWQAGALAFDVAYVLREHAGLCKFGRGRNFPELGDGSLSGMASAIRRLKKHIPHSAGSE
jgi:hypothetical protein